MEEKLDAVLEKLEELSERIGKIEERIEELENDAAAERNDILCELQGVTQFVETLYEYKKLDFPKLDCENLIFVHTNALRTASLIEALANVCGGLVQTNEMTKKYLTPEYLSDLIKRETYIVVKSEIFSWSPDFERIIANAMATGETYFAILTNDIESVPQSIRDKMRVMK